MRLFALRLLVLGTLVLVYELNAVLGVAALAGGVGYVLAARHYRHAP